MFPFLNCRNGAFAVGHKQIRIPGRHDWLRVRSAVFEFNETFCTVFSTPRNTTYEAEAGELPYDDMKKSEAIIPSQAHFCGSFWRFPPLKAGWNKGDSQKLMTGFGTPRDVKGKHLKRIWELEYPEEAEISLDRLWTPNLGW